MFHLASKGGTFKIRDGAGGKLLDVVCGRGTPFYNLDPRDFLFSSDVFICELEDLLQKLAPKKVKPKKVEPKKAEPKKIEAEESNAILEVK